MAALQQARMACDAAGLVDKETEGSPKLDELNRLLEELCLQSNRKVVIFSQWERMTAMIEKNVKRLGLGSVRLHGGVPVHKRGTLMDQFREVVEGLAKKYDAIYVNSQKGIDRILKYLSPIELAADKVHMGKVGHTLIAREFLSAIEFHYDKEL